MTHPDTSPKPTPDGRSLIDDSDGRGPTIIAVSLKMYFDPNRTVQWSTAVADLGRTHPALTSGRVKLVVLPSFLTLGAAVKLFARTPVAVGAQDLFYEDRGAFTGEVSGADLRQIGCEYVEIGHTERRRLFGEDERVVNLKMRAAWRNGLTPLLCVGESVSTTAAQAARECVDQVTSAVAGGMRDGKPRPLVVAYEPTWAIGAAEPANSDHIAAVTRTIRDCLDADPCLAHAAIIYGGSARRGMLEDIAESTSGLFLGRYAHDPQALRSVLDETM